MIKDAEEKGVDKIVMKSTNRLVATKEEYTQLKQELAQEGIDLDDLGVEIIAMDGTNNCLQSSVVEDYILNTNSDE